MKPEQYGPTSEQLVRDYLAQSDNTSILFSESSESRMHLQCIGEVINLEGEFFGWFTRQKGLKLKEELFKNLFAGNTALIIAIVIVLLKKGVFTADELIREIDDLINKSVDKSGSDTAALQHMRYVLMKYKNGTF